MNKLIVFMVSLTLLLWGMFLWKMSDKVASRKDSEIEKSEQVASANLDMQGVLSLLEPQEMLTADARNPFLLPKRFTQVPKLVKREQNIPVKEESLPAPAVSHPAIMLDAVLPGDNPVAILKFRGESAVVKVGQEIWGVTVSAIKNDGVILHDEIGDFEIK